MNAITPFVFEDHLVRSITRDEEPWFLLADVCGALEIKNARDVASNLEPDEVSTVAIADGQGGPERNIVSLPGVWRIIGRSRGAKAKPFQRWLYHEVIPALFKTGTYSMNGNETGPFTDQGEPFSLTAESVTVMKTRIDLVSECRRLHGHERARALWSAIGLPLPPAFPRGPAMEGRDCFMQLLLASDPRGAPVHQLVDLAMDEDEDARMRLKIIGVIVDPGTDGVIVANRSAWLNNLYKGSQWAEGRWRHGLRRLSGAQCAGSARRYPGYMSRGTFVPADHLDFAEKLPS